MKQTNHAPDLVIDIKGLSKRFGKVKALDNLDLQVAHGEVHGFLGPNGAGKSTTIRILLGLLRADRGSVKLFGEDPWRHAVELHRRLAYVPGDVELWPNLTGGEAIDVFARLRGRFDAKRRDELCKRFDLDPTKKCRTYSKGNRQKVALIAALASDVELLLLDEPTAGLDPLKEAVFQEIIRELKQKGVTVLLSSHILAQVEVLADRVSIIRNGSVVETGTLDELRHLTRTTITAKVSQSAESLKALPGVHAFSQKAGRVQLEIDADSISEVMKAMAALKIQSITARPPTLEQLLMRHYHEDTAKAKEAS